MDVKWSDDAWNQIHYKKKHLRSPENFKDVVHKVICAAEIPVDYSLHCVVKFT